MQKKNLPYVVVVILLSLIFYSSCSKEKVSANYEIENVTEIITNFNQDKLSFQQAETIEGQVYMRAAENDMIVIFVNNERMESSVIAYQLQMLGLKDKYFEAEVKNAQVLFFRNSLVVNSIDGKERYVFKLLDADNVITPEHSDIVMSGFGLSRSTLPDYLTAQETILRDSPYGDPGDPPAIEGCTCESAVDDSECDSGGIGATACSGSYGSGGVSCSVTCSSTGVYACCKPSES